jgi:hypothetical protein
MPRCPSYDEEDQQADRKLRSELDIDLDKVRILEVQGLRVGAQLR